jgi:cytochrome c-type biogenesis protein
MPDLPLALLAGILTIAAPCTLPVLPILLGASIGRRAGARPAFIAAGFVASFAFVALALNAVATALHFDPDVLRTAGQTGSRTLAETGQRVPGTAEPVLGGFR